MANTKIMFTIVEKTPINFSKHNAHSSNVCYSKITPTDLGKQHAKSSTAAL